MEIRSKLDLFEYEYEKIAMLEDVLILKLQKNKLYKEDRELLLYAVQIITEIRRNQY